MSTPTPAAPFVRSVTLRRPDALAGTYVAGMPAIMGLGRLELHPHVTFFCGENGSGKSTLVEAIAVAVKLNTEGGTQRFRFATRKPDFTAAEALELEWAPIKPLTSFFLRGEGGIAAVEFEDAEQVKLTRSFLENRERFLRYLFED